jgi:hypothetical protein
MKSKENSYIENSKHFISLVGTKKLCEIGCFTPQSLTGWKKRGIPRAWALYLADKFKPEWNTAFNK